MPRLGTAYIDFQGRDSNLVAASRRSRRELGRLGRAANLAGRGFVALTRRVGRAARGLVSIRGAVALLAGGGGLGLLIRQQAKAGAGVVELSRLFGLQSERLISLQRAAENEGIATRQTNLAVQRLVRRYGDAVGGQKQLQQAFADLSVELRDAHGNLRTTDSLLADVADGLARTVDPSIRLSRAFKLFDSEGARFASTLVKGSVALEEQRRQLEAQRGALDRQNESLKAIDQSFTDSGRRISDALGRAVAGSEEDIRLLIVAVTDLAVAFVEMVPDVTRWGANMVATADVVAARFGIITETISGIVEGLRELDRFLDSFGTVDTSGPASFLGGGITTTLAELLSGSGGGVEQARRARAAALPPVVADPPPVPPTPGAGVQDARNQEFAEGFARAREEGLARAARARVAVERRFDERFNRARLAGLATAARERVARERSFYAAFTDAREEGLATAARERVAQERAFNERFARAREAGLATAARASVAQERAFNERFARAREAGLATAARASVAQERAFNERFARAREAGLATAARASVAQERAFNERFARAREAGLATAARARVARERLFEEAFALAREAGLATAVRARVAREQAFDERFALAREEGVATAVRARVARERAFDERFALAREEGLATAAGPASRVNGPIQPQGRRPFKRCLPRGRRARNKRSMRWSTAFDLRRPRLRRMTRPRNRL